VAWTIALDTFERRVVFRSPPPYDPDRFRPPYGRVPEGVPRSVVFCGTVNHGGYLKDRTGNRRFWVVRCSGRLDPEGLGVARDALWAEAQSLYDAGESWHLAPDEEARMREEQAARVEGDPWEDLIAAWTVRRGGETFTMNELLEAGLGLSAHGRNPRVTSRVSRILEGLGFERRRAMVGGAGRTSTVRRGPCCLTAPLPHFKPESFRNQGRDSHESSDRSPSHQ
jgi:hypothetical protein